MSLAFPCETDEPVHIFPIGIAHEKSPLYSLPSRYLDCFLIFDGC